MSLPSAQRAIIRDPDLAALVEGELGRLSGQALHRAQRAVAELATAGRTGTWDQLVAWYREAIRQAARG
jgi:hypothetical protein